MRDYLMELERKYGGALPMPRSWTISAEPDKMPEDQTPAVVIVSPGLFGPPEARGDGCYTATWRISLSVVVSARGNGVALVLARRYALAMRAIALQKQALDGLEVRGVNWLDERYSILDTSDDRTLCVAAVDLAVEVSDVTRRRSGPLVPTPDATPLPPLSPCWSEVVEVDVTVDKEPLGSESA
jgi:hypothetical protein